MDANALIPNARQKRLLARIEELGSSRPDDLAEWLGVSAPTVRRDIKALVEAGLVSRYHGGVSRSDNAIIRSSFQQRRIEHADLKREIALAAIDAIPDGATVFLGTGTTIEIFANLWPSSRPITVFTSSVFSAAALATKPNVALYVMGGHVHGAEGNLLDATSTAQVSQLSFDIALIGFSAVTETGALMDFDVDFAPVKEAVAKRAVALLLLADKSKFGKRAIIEPHIERKGATLMTNQGANAAIVARLTATGLHVIQK